MTAIKRRRYTPPSMAIILGASCLGYVMIISPLRPDNTIRRQLLAINDAGQTTRQLSEAQAEGHRRQLDNRFETVVASQKNRDLFGISFLSEAEPVQCKIPPALPPKQRIAPTFAASYPGSGAKMSWNLITGLSGVQTGDDWMLNNVEWSEAVTVKTHFPHPEGNQEIGKMIIEQNLKASFPRAVIILRHPMNAIPGYHNYLYEAERGLPGHSTRAPLGEWIKWRDQNAIDEINCWVDHLTYWTDLYGSSTGGLSPEGKVERQIISYEGMISDTHGPANALALAKFLDNTNGIDVTTDPEAVGCIWQKVIKYKGQDHAPDAKVKESERMHRSGSMFRPYSLNQYDFMISQLKQLATNHQQDKQLRPILDSYIDMAENAKRVREEEQTANGSATAEALAV